MAIGKMLNDAGGSLGLRFLALGGATEFGRAGRVALGL